MTGESVQPILTYNFSNVDRGANYFESVPERAWISRPREGPERLQLIPTGYKQRSTHFSEQLQPLKQERARKSNLSPR